MKGTFYYDEKSKKLSLKHSDGKRVGVIDITLSGDAESTVFDGTGEATQYECVALWTDDKGECILATADRAPRDKQVNLGKWCAKALAIFAPLSHLMYKFDPYLDWLLGWLRGKPQPLSQCRSRYGFGEQEYKRPPARAFVPEFLRHWRASRHHALRGWLFVLGGIIGYSIGYWLFG